MFKFFISDCVWSSDWNGYEVGFNSISVVGLYTKEVPSGTVNFYINVETGEVLDIWLDVDE